ncbi:MAG: DnaJ domain-containing protein [Chloroflexi bacterium]|nr:DnaJ domain-containing protein [Chloroflexota bacterium]
MTRPEFAWNMVNYYEILGVPRHASLEEIRAAYREAVRRWHPDINPSPEAREFFLLVRQAYEVLSNPQKRQAYDQTLEQSPETQEMSGTALVGRGRAPRVQVRLSYSLVRPLGEPQLWYAFWIVRAPWPAPRQPRPLEMWLVLDRSSSMRHQGKMALLKEAVAEVLKRLRPTDRLGLVAFDDRAELLLHPTPVRQRNLFLRALESLRPRGATEIAHALRMVDGSIGRGRSRGPSVVWIFTDGRTYGDETTALDIARQWAQRGIICDAFGLGDDWNEAFLDRLTGLTGGSTHYLKNLAAARPIFQDHLRRYHYARVRQLNLHFNLSPGVKLHALYRMGPEVAHLSVEPPVALGTVGPNERWLTLAELELPPLHRVPPDTPWPVLEGRWEFVPFRGAPLNEPLRLTVRVGEGERSVPPKVVRHAVERLTWYRLQQASRQAWRDGRIEEAQQLLSHLAQGLARRGLGRLARDIQVKALELDRDRQLDPEAEKALEFGTRMLMLPANVYEARRQPGSSNSR